ncbi:hypothetical protein, variant [Aphanomyces invadans]|uniref:PX domain-containing protein n=1 Tax=Aphanomyces invadans TaxID=157072 RepID=A0A024TKT8_9STRA|nr:hypothetical protein, variant [Aphanomyces invadans]ETV94765.1 hypothetical protein, variant [Aphanomyces invadans]|eukprot:XP_008876709.1 hypothetical protein, variant [Aphanomyces invadans]
MSNHLILSEAGKARLPSVPQHAPSTASRQTRFHQRISFHDTRHSCFIRASTVCPSCSFDPNFIAKRQAGLQAYLDALLQVYGILEDRSLQHFFEIEKNVELHTDHIRQSTQSVGSNGHVKLMSETDRWQLIVEKAEHELIDISEVPEPLEVDQARQKRAEVLAAYTATRSATVRSRPLKTVPTFWDGSTAPGPHAATSAWLRQLHGRLHEAFQTQQSIKQPSEDLIAFMPPPVDMVAAH